MLGVIFVVWCILAIGIPIYINGWNVGRANHFEALEDSAYRGDLIDPSVALVVQRKYMLSEREVAILWLISGSGNIIGLLIAYGHFVTYDRLKSEYANDAANYVMWRIHHPRHLDEGLVDDCPYCKGDWYFETNSPAIPR